MHRHAVVLMMAVYIVIACTLCCHLFSCISDAIEHIPIMWAHANFAVSPVLLLIKFSSMEYFPCRDALKTGFVNCFLFPSMREMRPISNNNNSDQPLSECTITIVWCVCISFWPTKMCERHTKKTTIKNVLKLWLTRVKWVEWKKNRRCVNFNRIKSFDITVWRHTFYQRFIWRKRHMSKLKNSLVRRLFMHAIALAARVQFKQTCEKIYGSLALRATSNKTSGRKIRPFGSEVHI